VTDHGGTIEACNVDGSGARFTVTLPRVVTNEPSQ
jgi:signal transduction histidine kinase